MSSAHRFFVHFRSLRMRGTLPAAWLYSPHALGGLPETHSPMHSTSEVLLPNPWLALLKCSLWIRTRLVVFFVRLLTAHSIYSLQPLLLYSLLLFCNLLSSTFSVFPHLPLQTQHLLLPASFLKTHHRKRKNCVVTTSKTSAMAGVKRKSEAAQEHATEAQDNAATATAEVPHSTFGTHPRRWPWLLRSLTFLLRIYNWIHSS
jgi:hypothetical protein